MTFAQFLQILRARRAMITTVALALTLAGALVTFLLPQTYLAQVALVTDVKDTIRSPTSS